MRVDPDTLPADPIKVTATEVVPHGNGTKEEPQPHEDNEVEEAEVVEQEQIRPQPQANPFRVVMLLTKVHGAKWAMTDAAKRYFGQGGMKTAKDFQAFAQQNPDAWRDGCAKLVEASKQPKK
jgi:hypothetical protein